jgi:uncharacterized membrane protein YhaH (DUF805 family)
MMEGRIFINYRRDISAQAAGRLSDRLTQHFDRERLFMDVDAIEPGVDFVKALDDQVAQASAFIAVIGPGWTELKNAEGQRRLDQPNDHVRIEIESALKRDIRVIPVLVDGAQMPTTEQLPDSIKPFSRRNAVILSHHRFNPEVDELARTLQRALGLPAKSITTTYAFAARETPTPSWIDFLFSFEGRISRKSYWLSSLAILVVVFLFMVVLGTVLGLEWDMIDREKGTISTKLSKLSSLAVLPFFWPLFALYLKRLHDFGQGQGVLWLAVIIIVLMYGLSFASYDHANVVLLIFYSGLCATVGLIKGTPGPNQYGSDPLANIARKSAP